MIPNDFINLNTIKLNGKPRGGSPVKRKQTISRHAANALKDVIVSEQYKSHPPEMEQPFFSTIQSMSESCGDFSFASDELHLEEVARMKIDFASLKPKIRTSTKSLNDITLDLAWMPECEPDSEDAPLLPLSGKHKSAMVNPSKFGKPQTFLEKTHSNPNKRYKDP